MYDIAVALSVVLSFGLYEGFGKKFYRSTVKAFRQSRSGEPQ